jgi:hypothetical protein
MGFVVVAEVALDKVVDVVQAGCWSGGIGGSVSEPLILSAGCNEVAGCDQSACRSEYGDYSVEVIKSTALVSLRWWVLLVS